ncbi:sel1 repeat family protein [Bradyrhizobium ontarionense]|uniref:Sel1 repeat family protein n=1 Tax=Bradyrhizobium ontarionense TaxID=2898149 RepID=A0ABY3RK12_9BRAD|nr:tetratricopeptide repeat protein [Bradyrhizobium sp. A19]UFZ07147.1 sel1 repeat family protein [Bradyrhizobium sp. A19]
MICVSAPAADPCHARLTKRGVFVLLCTCVLLGTALSPAGANSISTARSAYARGDFVRAVRVLTPLALHGNPQAQAMLGFMYENGFGAPQAYDAASDLYCRAAAAGNPFGQAMLGLMYDKGHGVPQDVVLAYKWLNLAAGHAGPAQRSYYLRLRNAVASKMSSDQIAQGQALALSWALGQF